MEKIESLNHRNIESLDAQFNDSMIQCSDDSIRSAKAFTLLEILVVLTIIAILGGILLVAMHGLLGGGKANQTKATLGTLRGMLSEYENATHFQNAPVAWEWQVSGTSTGVVGYIVGSATYPPPSPPTADFWRIPSVNTTGTGGNFPDPLISPGSVVDGQNDRSASVAMINTQIVMSMLASLPVNQGTLAKLSPIITTMLPWATGNNTISKGADLSNGNRPTVVLAGLPDAASFDVLIPSVYGYGGALTTGSSHQSVGTTSSAINYVQGVQVSATINGQKSYFRNIGTGLNNAAVPSPNQSNSNWAPTSTPAPVLLDAWSNPIIFVPGSGLLVWSKSQGVQDSSTGIWYVKPVLIQSPDHKPFFASAGPDGDFSSGDDNIYSFEE